MSKLTDFYTHKASLLEERKPIDPQWEMLEDQLLKEELLPELIEQLKSVLSKVKSPLMFSGCYDPNGCLSVSFTRNYSFACRKRKDTRNLSKMKKNSAKRGDLLGFLLIFAMSLINKCIYGVQKNKVYSCTHEENWFGNSCRLRRNGRASSRLSSISIRTAREDADG